MERYDGFYVCSADFEGKHPLEYSRVIQDKQTVPIHLPQPPDVFVEVNYRE